MSDAGDGCEGGGEGEYLGTACPQAYRSFGESHIVARLHPDSTDGRLIRNEQRIAWLGRLLLEHLL